jgi:GH18 family chitinase
MKNIALAVLALFLSISSARADLPTPKVVVAYVPTWIDLNRFVDQIPYEKLTHINIAFENPIDDHGTLSFNPRSNSVITKAHKNNVKVLCSIGGGSAASDKTLKPRYELLMSEKNRAEFAKKIAAFLEKHEFDGVDVDIEGPSIGKDYGPFIEELAKALAPKKFLLTAALSRDYGGKNVPKETLPHFDFINIMAYDNKGPWNQKDPGQHSSLDYAKEQVKYWLDRGLEKKQTVLGVPFYGYGFGNAFRKDAYAYNNILAKFPTADAADEIGDTIWYNGTATIKAKTKFVIDENLAGVMIWSLDNDAKGDKSLLWAIHETLNPKK